MSFFNIGGTGGAGGTLNSLSQAGSDIGGSQQNKEDFKSA